MIRPHPSLIALLMVCLLCACAASPSVPTPTPPQGAAPTTGGQAATPAPAFLTDRTTPDIPAVVARKEAIAAALRADPPILTLPSLEGQAASAQARAISDPRVVESTRTADGSGPLLVEVFGVVQARESDLTDASAACRGRAQGCWKVVLYNFGTNTAITAITDEEAGTVLDVTSIPNAQPDIPPHLADLAVEIARASPEVQREMGMEPCADQSIYEAVKTSVSGSQCERSHHLCVAPTFRWGNGALWAVVDLTDMALIGGQPLPWTDFGATSGRRVSEVALQDAVVSGLCEQEEPYTWGPWSLSYGLTSSDGLVINNVTYNGRPWLHQAKITDWHISYGGRQDEQRVGYADAVGCPTFSSAAVVPFNLPTFEPIMEGGQQVGVAIVQDFRSELWPIPCNYRYQNRYEFYQNGRFRMLGVNVGRGCGLGGVYRPIYRIVPAGSAHEVAAWDGSGWQPWTTEQWTLQQPGQPRTEAGDEFRIAATGGPTLLVRPTTDPRPDNAYVYVSRWRAEEGDADLSSLGTCCNEDENQGPQTFLQPPEPLDGAPITLWYVPQIPNEERAYCWADSTLDPATGTFTAQTWPCSAGPWLIPDPASTAAS